MKAPRSSLTPQLLADWAEDRFHASVDFALGGVRLYGLTVVDLAGDRRACRLCFLGEVADLGDLLGARMVLELANFDAAVLLTTRWMAGEHGPPRPASFGGRRRARAVVVADDRGVAATVRFAHRADDPMPWQPAGAEAAVLAALWRAARR